MSTPAFRTFDNTSPRILVVDGSKVVRKMIEGVLRQQLPQAEIILCENGDEAKVALQQGAINLVTTALRLPELNGCVGERQPGAISQVGDQQIVTHAQRRLQGTRWHARPVCNRHTTGEDQRNDNEQLGTKARPNRPSLRWFDHPTQLAPPDPAAGACCDHDAKQKFVIGKSDLHGGWSKATRIIGGGHCRSMARGRLRPHPALAVARQHNALKDRCSTADHRPWSTLP